MHNQQHIPAFAAIITALLFLLVPFFAFSACNPMPIACPEGAKQFYSSYSDECPEGNFYCGSSSLAPTPHVKTSRPAPLSPPAQSRTVTPPAAASATLSVGMRGDAVLVVQRQLISLGYLAAENDTGFFGQLTQAAVQTFQRERGIVFSGTPATTGYGAVGPRTRGALGSAKSLASDNQTLVETLMAEVARLTAILNSLLSAAGKPTLPSPNYAVGGGGVGGSSLPTSPVSTPPASLSSPQPAPPGTPACTIDTASLDNCVLQ